MSGFLDFQKQTHEFPQLIMCGDFNNKNIDSLLADHPDLRVLETPTTRKDETLDLCLSNLDPTCTMVKKFEPLQSITGRPSDHDCIAVTVKQEKKHIFVKETFRFRPYTDEGEEKFGKALAAVDWAGLYSLTANDAVNEMNTTLKQMYEQSFPEVTRTVKSSDPPWLNKKVKRMVNKKRKYYKKRGKNDLWREIDGKTKREVFLARRGYADKVKKKVLAEKNPRALFRAIKHLKAKEAPPQWDVTKLFPGKSKQDIAVVCAEYFSSISREFAALPPPPQNPNQHWSIELHEISAKLKHCHKARTLVKGDLKPELVKKYHDLLAIPLYCIYNKILRENSWPLNWKEETVHIIPKKTIPESIKDVRNISCTPLFSKVLEQFLLEKLRQQVKLDDCQFGGLKGVSIEHFLCETWHEILMHLEDPNAAASLVSIDFSKAFNRMDHEACLQALRQFGVDENLILIVHAFLQGRKMSVHVGGVSSPFMDAPGGAPQGSVLGSFLFCVATQGLAKRQANSTASFHENGESRSMESTEISGENPLSPIAAPEDQDHLAPLMDLTLSSDDENIDLGIRRPNQRLLDTTIASDRHSQTEIVEWLELPDWEATKPTVKAYIDDYNVLEKIRIDAAVSHFSENAPVYHAHAPESENIFDNVKKNSSDIGMLVNDDKTQLLCIHAKPQQIRSFIRTGDDRNHVHESADSLKILGFTFSNVPDASLNVRNLVRKFSGKLWGMRFLKRTGLSQADLLFIYKTTIRPIIEFASAAYHTLLNKEQSAAIEALQMRVMKVIYGELISYRSVIESGVIDLIQTRREKNFENFAMKVSKNERFANKWLEPNRTTDVQLRRREKYLIPRFRTDRANKSPIIQIRRLLNSR